MMRISIITCLFVAGIFPGPGAARAESRLTPLEEKYRTALMACADAAQARIADLNPKYLAQLEKIEADCRAAADLDNLIAVKAEMKRFEKEPTVTPLDFVKPDSALRTAQQKYHARLEDIEVEEARCIEKITSGYEKVLSALQVTLTREGSIPEAKAVRAARKQWAESIRYQWALEKIQSAQQAEASRSASKEANSPRGKEANFSARQVISIRGNRLSADWTPISINIVPGDHVSLTTQGTWVCPGIRIPCGPEGHPAYTGLYYRRRTPDFPYGALLLRIGRQGQLMQVDAATSFIASEKGILYLDANVEDDRSYRKEARGEIIVSVDVIRNAPPD